MTSIERHNPATSPTNADTLTWRVTFNEPVRNLDGGDFSTNGTNLPRFTVTQVSGSDVAYDITASGIDPEDYDSASQGNMVSLFLLFTHNIVDLAGNRLPNTTPTGAESYTLDNAGPTVTITGVPPTSTAAFTATFTFSEVVTGFTVGDIRVGNATVLDFTATTTTPAGSVYTALITPTISGVTTTVDVAANVAEDAAGNGNTAASRASSSYTGVSQPVISIEAVHTHAMPYLADVEFRVSRPAAATTALTVSLSIAQTASYLRNTSPSVTIPANQASAIGRYNSTYSGATSGTVTATVVVATGYAPAAAPANAATVNFVVTGLPLTAGWAQDAYTVTEGETLSAGVTLRTRDGAPKPREDYSIGIETLAGTALGTTTEAANDYVHRSIRVVVAPDAWSADGMAYTATAPITVVTVDDSDYEGEERFRLQFSRWSGNPDHEKTCTGEYLSGIYCLASVTLAADDDRLALAGVAVTSRPTSGDIYVLGENIEFTATFYGTVTATGAPRFAFILGTETKQAAYTSSSGPTKLVFSYTVSQDDGDTDGIAWSANALALNGGTIKFTTSTRADAIDAELTHAAAAAQSGHKVEAAAPTAPRRVSAETPAGVGGYMKVTWLVPSIVPAAADVYQVLLEPVSGRFPDGSPTRTYLTARADGKNATSLEIRGLPADREFRVTVRAATRGTVVNGVDFSSWHATGAGSWSLPVVVRTRPAATIDNRPVLSLGFPDGSLITTVKEGEQVDYRVRIAGINNTVDLDHPLAGVTTVPFRFGPRGAQSSFDGVQRSYERRARGIVKRDLAWETATTAHVDRRVTVPGGAAAQSPLVVELSRDTDLQLTGVGRIGTPASLCIEVTDSSGNLAAGGGCTASVCERTKAVSDAIVAAVSGASECGQVSRAHLAGIGSLTFPANALRTSGLKEGDFDGLRGLTSLTLLNNALTTLPAGIFDDLKVLTELDLRDNDLDTDALSGGVFDNLKALTILGLGGNDLATLPAGVFDNLTALAQLSLIVNGLTELRADVFDKLPAMFRLELNSNELTTLPDNVFEKLTVLSALVLSVNPGVATFVPVANAGGIVRATTGSTVTLSGRATGPWGSNVTWAWKQVTDATGTTDVSSTEALPLTGADTATPSFTAPSSTDPLYFHLTVTGKGTNITNINTDTNTVTVTVTTSSLATTAPSVTGVTILPETDDGSWEEGETVEAALTFDEAVTVDTTGGTPAVTLTLGASTQKSAGYVRGSGTTELVFGYTLAKDEGPYDSVLLTLNSLALNGGAIRSTASGADAALAHDGFAVIGGPTPRGVAEPGPTASFSALPERHDGESAFDIELQFSAAPDALSYRTVGGGLLEVTGGAVQKARRKTAHSNIGWVVTIRPSGSGDIAIRLPARACGEANAVCFDNRPLARNATATVPGVPFSASFAGAPGEHDGDTAFTVNFHLSLAPATLSSYRTVRDSLFDVTGARIVKVRRLTPRKNQNWELTVAPGGLADVTLRLKATTSCSALPGVCDAAGRMLAGGLSTTVRGPVALSVADAQGEEGTDETIGFAVSLSRAASGTVTVDYATADGTATAGEDYSSTSGTLTFAAGETSKTVSVPVLDDVVDEGQETFTLRLSNATGARIADAEATGTVSNGDPLQKMWLSRFGRTVADHVVDAVAGRLSAPLAGAQITLAGQSVDLSRTGDSAVLVDAVTGLARAFGAPGGGAASGETAPGAWPDRHGGAWDSPAASGGSPVRSVTGRELLLGSSFHLALDGEGGGGTVLTAWGRATVGGFDGQGDAETGAMRMDGEVITGILGADAQRGRWLGGLAFSVSEGEGTFEQPEAGHRGTIESNMTSVNPYLRFEASERLSTWGLLGFGTGEMTITEAARGDRGETVTRTGIEMRLAAVGARGALLDAATSGGFDLAVKADAFLVETEWEKVSNERDTQAGASRLRLVLEGSRAFELSESAKLTPGLELGLRHDGGDAETGTGVEVGGSVRYADVASGLSVEARGRTLIAHEASGFEEWGASASVRLDPGAEGRGLSFSLAPTLGAASSGVDRLWALQDARVLAPEGKFVAARSLEAQIGYGFGAFGDHGLAKPYVGLSLGEGGARTWRGGVRWTLGQSLDLGLEVSRDEAANDNDPDHGIGFRLNLRW